MLSYLLEKTINSITGQVIYMDYASQMQLNAMGNTTVMVDISSLSMKWLLSTKNGVLALSRVVDDQKSLDLSVVDACISGPLAAFVEYLSLSDQEAVTLAGVGLTIQGDLDKTSRLLHILKSINPDWEAKLSQFTGDVIAHSVARKFRQVAHWQKQSINRFKQDSALYLQRELNTLIHPQQAEQFYQQLEQLQLDVDRISARVKLLHSMHT